MPTDSQCPFCQLSKERIWLTSDSTIAFFDSYPISEGHSLVVPKRHVASVFDLPVNEFAEIWQMVGKVRTALQSRFRPDAFNIGINDGIPAGQTVAHAHIHVIPRRKGDVPDPRGGIRWIIAEKADYWTRR